MIAILGAGAWGTALAIKLSSRFDVALWARDATLAESIAQSRVNEAYLPGFAIPERVAITGRLDDAIRNAVCRSI